MIKITQEELYAWNELNNAIQLGQEELQRRVAARDAYLALLEGKYNAKFDPQSGKLIPKDGHKDEQISKTKVPKKIGG